MKNEENVELNQKIQKDLNYIKVKAVLQDILQKFDLLDLINQNEDNSSELAGFEINKLLKEQAKLESLYNNLITQRNLLKGIKNKKDYLAIQAQINDVSRSLKESTKKLCRLFKENKNLNEDIIKVKEERDEAVQLIQKMLNCLNERKFEEFEEKIQEMLEGHNKLEEYQKIEKNLLNQIKKIKAEISSENEAFQSEMNDKKNNIANLKEDLNKTKMNSQIELKYLQKELITTEKTQQRLYQQIEEELLNEKIKYKSIKAQEEVVFNKNQEYMLKENERLKKSMQDWNEKFYKDQEVFEQKQLQLNTLKEKDTQRLIKLKEIYKKEIIFNEQEEQRIKFVFEERRKKIESEKEKEEVITKIQFNFEKWFDQIGQFMKMKKKKKS